MPKITQNFIFPVGVSIGLSSLANGATVVSSNIDNTTDKDITATIICKLKTTSTVDTVDGSVTLFLLRSADNGITFDDSGSNMQPIGMFKTNVDNTTFIFSIDTISLGTLPDRWKIALTNNSGAALDSDPGQHDMKYKGQNWHFD